MQAKDILRPNPKQKNRKVRATSQPNLRSLSSDSYGRDWMLSDKHRIRTTATNHILGELCDDVANSVEYPACECKGAVWVCVKEMLICPGDCETSHGDSRIEGEKSNVCANKKQHPSAPS